MMLLFMNHKSIICKTVIFASGANMGYGHPHSHSQAKGHAGRVVMEVIDKYYEHTPGFQDVFDEKAIIF